MNAIKVFLKKSIPSARCSWEIGSLPGYIKTRYSHLARVARFACSIPGMQDGATSLMDDILTPILIDLMTLHQNGIKPRLGLALW